jgi:hypothetical protein
MFRVSSRAKAEREFARAEELLGGKLILNSCERYWKDESNWRCEAVCDLAATSVEGQIAECLLVAHNLANTWQVTGPSLRADGRLEHFHGLFDVAWAKTPLSSLRWADFRVIHKP